LRLTGPGSPETLGVTVLDDAIEIAVHAPDADAIAVCFFDQVDTETARIRLPARTGSVFHGRIAGVPPGTRYGLRAYGPWDPGNGHRFNPSKLLLDPWATTIDRPFRLHDWLFDRDAPRQEDTAALMPKAVVGTPSTAPFANRPSFDWDRQIILELHVRGFTMTHPDIPPAIRGTFAALGHPASLRHLTRLGITTVELMPSAAWVDERHLPSLHLSNYWGYNPIAFLAPDPRLAPGGWPEVRAAVDALHAAGICVILDVVLNHSGECDELGPTLSLRGLDNAGYYRLAADKSRYVNDAGCGNILAMDRPPTLRLGMDALRAWAIYGGMDGFRLDLATTLARRDNGFDPHAPFLAAVEQDPILSRCAMIAEPWDIGPGGYQLGEFPARWGEWNDRFRDSVRRFWRGDAGMLGTFATAFAGSGDVFPQRPMSRGINFVIAHDGFSLADLVSYENKHNFANGEDNRDGSNDNFSWNNGAEGPTSDPLILAARARDARALLATLLLSRGSPMLSMGDELGRTQGGNNNAYAQDNARSWVDWDTADQYLIDFTAALITLRRTLAPLFDGQALRGQPAPGDTIPDVTWHGADGQDLTEADWNRPTNHTLVAILYVAPVRAALVFHADTGPIELNLPTPRHGYQWSRVLDSAATNAGMTIAPRSVTVFQETEHLVPATTDAKGSGRGAGVTDGELDRLAERAGINPIWWDVEGGHHTVCVDTKHALLAAMRLPAGTRDDLSDSLARLMLQPALLPNVTATSASSITIELGQPRPAWLTLLREDGSLERFHTGDGTRDGTGDGQVTLPPQPIGRHRLLNEDQPDHFCHLTVAPDSCYLPPSLQAGARRFGIAAHLYALRSKGDQGIGDFTTLARFGTIAAQQGAALIGLNPLHALFPHDRSRTSPYHPSDRRFLDPIYLDVSGLPGYSEIASPDGTVDYPLVWQRKRAMLHAAFKPNVSAPMPPALRQFATFQAITESLGTSDWRNWPTELRHPDSPGTTQFASQHEQAVQFHAWMQILADQQLAQAAASSRRDGLSLGFYRDLAVGAAPDGAEAWAAQDTLMHGVSVGAPPDTFSVNGQVWSLPPPNPMAMRGDGFSAFNALLVANMRHAGALRIDHVMGMRRLFVVPDGASASDGAYIDYPVTDLLAQIALESQRASCVIVGEDLGTVPEGMTDQLAASNILSYSVLWFQREDDHILPPAEWPRLAAACVSTHDLPTLAGWWNATDIAEKRRLSLPTDPQAETARTAAKAALIEMLHDQGLLNAPVDPAQPMPDSVAAAIHAFVAATPALLALIQADDLAGETVAVNLPGTDKERPNWCRRLDSDVVDLCRTPLARAILGAMQSRTGVQGP
jgi:glycogen debranching enzyme GlgX